MPTEKTENFFAFWLYALLSGLTLVRLNVFTGPTPVVVQYMYNTCTIFVRLQLYKYCTTIVHILYNDRSWSLNGLEMWHC